jgi:hypothetical protein
MWGRLISLGYPTCMHNHLPLAQTLIIRCEKNLIPRLVNEPWLSNEYAHLPPLNPDSDQEQEEISSSRLVKEPWLTNVYAQPPPHSPNSDLERRLKLNPYAGLVEVPQSIQQAASLCAQYSSMNLIKEETTHRNPNDR